MAEIARSRLSVFQVDYFSEMTHDFSSGISSFDFSKRPVISNVAGLGYPYGFANPKKASLSVSLISGFEHIVRENESLIPFTRLKIGGVAEYFAEPTTIEELVELVKRFSENQIAIRVIGEGTNLLVRDEGVSGLVIQLSAPAFCTIDIQDRVVVAGGGTTGFPLRCLNGSRGTDWPRTARRDSWNRRWSPS